MNKRLELYLQTVEMELGGLEAEQRDSELREMRHHIDAIVARLIEGGLSESEATDAAIAQFGAARQVGRTLRKSKRERVPLWRIVAAPLCALVCHGTFYIAALLLRDAIYGLLFGAAWDSQRGFGWLDPSRPLDFFFTVVFAVLGPFMAGRLSARVGGRTAVWSVGIVYSLLCVLPIGINNEYFGDTIFWVCFAAFIEAYGSKRRRKLKRT